MSWAFQLLSGEFLANRFSDHDRALGIMQILKPAWQGVPSTRRLQNSLYGLSLMFAFHIPPSFLVQAANPNFSLCTGQ
jgi:hypothetical protein